MEAGQLDFAGETTALAAPSAFRAFLAKLRAEEWVVYAKPPFGGPQHLLAYLGRYTHRIAIDVFGPRRSPPCAHAPH